MTFDVDEEIDELVTEALDGYFSGMQDYIERKLIDAIRDGEDYFYVYLSDDEIRGWGFKPYTFGSSLSPEELDEYPIYPCYAYDLTVLTDDEREKIAVGEVPESLERL